MPRPRALRLFFAYEGPEVRLVSAEPVEMTPPPSDPLEPEEGTSGFWYELRDTRGARLYRRITHNPIRSSAEVLTDDRERPIAREELSAVRGHFVLLAPNPEEATSAVLVGPPADDPAAPAKEIARFDLRSAPKRADA